MILPWATATVLHSCLLAKVIIHIGNCSGSILIHVYINSQQLAHHFINHSECSKDIHSKEQGVLWNAGALWSAGMRDVLPSYVRSPGSEGMIEPRCSQPVGRERLRSTSLSICKKPHSHRVAKPAKQHLWNSQRAKCCLHTMHIHFDAVVCRQQCMKSTTELTFTLNQPHN